VPGGAPERYGRKGSLLGGLRHFRLSPPPDAGSPWIPEKGAIRVEATGVTRLLPAAVLVLGGLADHDRPGPLQVRRPPGGTFRGWPSGFVFACGRLASSSNAASPTPSRYLRADREEDSRSLRENQAKGPAPRRGATAAPPGCVGSSLRDRVGRRSSSEQQLAARGARARGALPPAPPQRASHIQANVPNEPRARPSTALLVALCSGPRSRPSTPRAPLEELDARRVTGHQATDARSSGL
jgi:hypothetical protein